MISWSTVTLNAASIEKGVSVLKHAQVTRSSQRVPLSKERELWILADLAEKNFGSSHKQAFRPEFKSSLQLVSLLRFSHSPSSWQNFIVWLLCPCFLSVRTTFPTLAAMLLHPSTDFPPGVLVEQTYKVNGNRHQFVHSTLVWVCHIWTFAVAPSGRYVYVLCDGVRKLVAYTTILILQLSRIPSVINKELEERQQGGRSKTCQGGNSMYTPQDDKSANISLWFSFNEGEMHFFPHVIYIVQRYLIAVQSRHE